MNAMQPLPGLLMIIALGGLGRDARAHPIFPNNQVPRALPAETIRQLEGLCSSDPHQAARAAGQLASGDPKRVAAAIPFLVAMLHDDTQLYGPETVMRLSLASSIPRVFSYPNTPGQWAAEALARIARAGMGKPVVDALIAPLTHENWVVRANAVRALGERWPGEMSPQERRELGAERAVGPLIAALEDRHARLRRDAAVVLDQLDSPRAVEPLIVCLRKDGSQEVREAAATALGGIADPDRRAVKPLIAVLGTRSESPEVRRNAAEALGRIGDPRAADPLMTATKDGDWRVRSSAVLALSWMVSDGRVLKPLLQRALQDEHWRVRTTAAIALRRLKGEDALELLFAALGDEHPNVRGSAADSLSELKDRRAVLPLIDALRRDPNSYVRRHAALALGELKDPRAKEALSETLNDESLRRTARWALQSIKQHSNRSGGSSGEKHRPGQ